MFRILARALPIASSLAIQILESPLAHLRGKVIAVFRAIASVPFLELLGMPAAKVLVRFLLLGPTLLRVPEPAFTGPSSEFLPMMLAISGLCGANHVPSSFRLRVV